MVCGLAPLVGLLLRGPYCCSEVRRYLVLAKAWPSSAGGGANSPPPGDTSKIDGLKSDDGMSQGSEQDFGGRARVDDTVAARAIGRRGGLRLAARALTFLVAPLMLVALSGCAGALNAFTSGAGYAVVKDIRYRPGARGTYDLYVPDGATARTPVVVFIYGGSWDSGNKGMYLFVGQSLASQGIIVAVPDYRVYPQVKFPTFVEDAALATATIARAAERGGNGVQAGKHPVFLMGHSAGAEIAGLLATDGRRLAKVGYAKSRLAGFIGLAGPYNFLPLTEDRYKAIFPLAIREESQPINYVGGDEPPMLLIAGDADTTVNPDNTRSMAARIRTRGGRVESRIVPGVDHIGAISAFATALPLSDRSIRGETLAFIKAHAR